MGNDEIRQHKPYHQREATQTGDGRGCFIVLEGSDSADEAAPIRGLADQLDAEGFEVAIFAFPRTDEPSGYFVRQYLDGRYGSNDQIGPYTGSLFYALDRFDAAEHIQEALDAGKVVLASRFTASSMAQQGTKFRDANERRGYFVWLDNLEYEILGIPRPDLNIVLRVPEDTSDAAAATSTGIYDELCQLFPKDYSRIDTSQGGQQLPADRVAKLVRDLARPYLQAVRRGKRIDATQAARQAQPQATPSRSTISGSYQYHVPGTLDPATAKAYRQAMDDAMGRHARLVHDLTEFVRARSDVPASGRDETWQARTNGIALAMARPVLPVAARPVIDLTATSGQPLRAIADQHLSSVHHPAQDRVADLVDVWPRNELELTADMLYGQTGLPLRALRQEIDSWPYDRKAGVIAAYLQADAAGLPGGSALERVRYGWDLFTDYDTFVTLYQQGVAEGLAWQDLTPRYGYATPQLIDDAGLNDAYDDCFDATLQLHSLLQRNGYGVESQFATLYGHRLHWKAAFTGLTLRRLAGRYAGSGTVEGSDTATGTVNPDSDRHDGLRALVQELAGQVRERHPLIAKSIFNDR